MTVFLHKIDDRRVVRDKVFWLANMMQNQQAVGFFANDTPPGTQQISRFGVEETVMDGVISLTLEVEGLERHRYLEIVKLRNTAHVQGRHAMTIGPGGLTVFPRIDRVLPTLEQLVPPAPSRQRRSSGVPALDGLLGGGLLDGSVTLVSGSPGTGKSTLGMQFSLEAARSEERALYISLEEGPGQLIQSAEELGLPVRQALDAGRLEILYLPREDLHASRFLSVVEDRVRVFQPTRVVLDSASDIEAHALASEELRQLLYGLVIRLRTLGVTSLFTLEASTLFFGDTLSEQGLAPLADNILMVRYTQEQDLLVPRLRVVKTRGSSHDSSSHRMSVGKGGVLLGEASTLAAESPPSRSGTRSGAKKKPRLGLKRKPRQ
jgi:circadian clock protein KaiC